MRSRGCGYRDRQPPSVESNTLYSAQECLNRRALGRVPDKELYFKPRCKQNKDHHVNHGDHWGGGGLCTRSGSGHTAQHMVRLGQLGQMAHTQGQTSLGELSEQL